MSKLTPVVETDELENVRAFCRSQLAIIGKTIDKIRGQQPSFPDPATERGQTFQTSFELLQKLFNDSRAALEDDFPNFDGLLRSLSAHIQLKRSSVLFKYATTSLPQRMATKRANVAVIDLMHEYIQNAENGCAQRRRIFAFCQEQNLEILGQFEKANRDETLARQAERPRKETEQRDPRPIPEPKKWKPVRHLPVQRGRLYQDRKRVSALGYRPARTAQSELMLRSRREVGGEEDT
jgi:hypothetical protein